MNQTSLPDWETWTTSGAWASSDTRTLPLSPGLLGEVLGLVRDPDVDALRLIKFISRDQAVAARVLRLANVAAFAPMIEVTSINTAVIRLGTEAVRRALLAVCFASWAQPHGATATQVKRQVAHAIACATLARHVAGSTMADGDEAFAQGLLHDIGKLFLLRLRAEYIRRGGKSPSDQELARVEAERHAEVGGLAMQLWGLPLALREPIRWHHDPLSAPTYPRAAAIIYVADALSHRYTEDGERTLELAADPAMTGLGLSDTWLARTDSQAPKLLEVADHLVLA
ncbi:MAG: HDOD domain-containing protein [Vicinamibacterales bacterium]